jgi:hypothetical protein
MIGSLPAPPYILVAPCGENTCKLRFSVSASGHEDYG